MTHLALIDAICVECGAACRVAPDTTRPMCPACYQAACDEIVLGGIALMDDRVRDRAADAA